MSTEPRRDGDNGQLPPRGLHGADDELARKIRDAVHKLPQPVPPAERDKRGAA